MDLIKLQSLDHALQIKNHIYHSSPDGIHGFFSGSGHTFIYPENEAEIKNLYNTLAALGPVYYGVNWENWDMFDSDGFKISPIYDLGVMDHLHDFQN